ncbi:MAG TPA: lipoyl(octanoyl) transferase LipB [Sedimentisphaerales bacterium]|nr:lipoyl(octanoyl) transferase LipB [Sedimentisphaerales bacterium]
MSVTGPNIDNATLVIQDLGLADYRQVLSLQHKLRDERQRNEIGNTVLIVEHPPVITLGARRSANKLVADAEGLCGDKIDLVQVRRGGGTTAHNPGQLVFYPIFYLPDFGLGIGEYVRALEATGIELLGRLGVQAEWRKGFPGLWVNEKKIASVGVRVSRQVTYHGMAINIRNDLAIFDLLVPCGLEGVEMTSVLKETGRDQDMDEVKKELARLLTGGFLVRG